MAGDPVPDRPNIHGNACPWLKVPSSRRCASSGRGAVSPPAHAAAGFTRKIARRILALGMVEQSVCRQVSKGRRFTPAGFSLVFAPHGGLQMVRLSLQHSLARLPPPAE